MATLPPLTSNSNPSAPEQQEVLSSSASDIQDLIVALTSNASPEASEMIKKLSSESPEIAAFVQEVLQDITDAKAATPQGILLAQQLQQGSITQAQFQSAVAKITLPLSQLQAAVSVNLPSKAQALILALSSNPKLNQLSALVASGSPKTPPNIAKLDGPAQGETSPKPPGPQPKLITQQTDVKLGNTQDFLTKMIKVAAQIAAQNARASAASLLSLKPQPRVMTGARAVVKLNGKVIALCNNVQYEVSTDWTEVRGIDELLPNDLAPASYSVKGSMSIFRVPNQSPVGEFLQQDMFRGVIWPYTSIEIRDKRTDEIILQVKRAAITSRSEAFTKGQLTSTNLSFIGIGFRDEIAPQLLPDKLTGQEEQGTGGLLDAFKQVTNIVKKLF